jgi:hypothetical protein
VYTVEELTSSMRDPVVAAHYAGLHASRVRPVTLERERRAYVSFRMHDAVYWTRRPVKLARGEQLLTDGENFVRARCGNRVSDIPRMPTVAEEPSESAMDRGETPRPSPPLSPGRSLAIVPVEPCVLPYQLALSIPPAPAGGPTFGPVPAPMPFLPPAGGYLGGTPSGSTPGGPSAPPADPGAPGSPSGGPVYDIPQPQPAPYTSGDIPWPHPEPGQATYIAQDQPPVPIHYPSAPLPKPSPGIIPGPPGKPLPGDDPKKPKPPAPPDDPGTPSKPPPPPTPPPSNPPPVYPPLIPDTPQNPPEPPTPPAPVPEPGTLALASGALAALWLWRRLRR